VGELMSSGRRHLGLKGRSRWSPQVGPLRVLVPQARRPGRQSFRGRVHTQTHQGPNEPGFGMHCRGLVRRVRGVPLVHQLRGVVKVPVAQGKPVDLRSTGARRPPDHLPGSHPSPSSSSTSKAKRSQRTHRSRNQPRAPARERHVPEGQSARRSSQAKRRVPNRRTAGRIANPHCS